MAEINRNLINILEPIYAHDCDGSKIDILPEALLSVESALLMKSRHELETRSNTSALAYLALAEAYKKKMAASGIEDRRNKMDNRSVEFVGHLMANMIEQNAPSYEMERIIEYSIACIGADKCYQKNGIDELIGKYGTQI